MMIKKFQDFINESIESGVPKQVLQLATELSELIKNCVDSDGDAVGVYDNSSTWQEEFIYKVELTDKKLSIYEIKDNKTKLYEQFPYGKKTKWDEDTKTDAIGVLKHLIKNYKRTIKSLKK